MIRNVVENYVVTLVTLREILFGVINHLIGSERSDHFQIAGAANPSYIGAERFGDLDSECTHASRGAVDQDLLARLNLSFIAHSLQCADTRDVDRGCLLNRNVRRFESVGPNCLRTYVIS